MISLFSFLISTLPHNLINENNELNQLNKLLTERVHFIMTVRPNDLYIDEMVGSDALAVVRPTWV